VKALGKTGVVFLFGLSALNAQSVWVADSLQRVGPSDAPGTSTSAVLYAAKGETESLQLFVRAPSNGMSVINITASDLTDPGGATIPKGNYTFYREYYVDITAASPDFGTGNRPLGAGWYPDPLIPFVNPATGLPLSGATYDAVPYLVPANINAPFWVDITVPRNALAGSYTGTITMSTSLGSFSFGVTLQVWNFTLPVVSNLKSSFGLHRSLTSLTNNEVLLQHRIQPFVILAKDFATLKPQGVALVGLPYYNQSSGCAINPPPTLAALKATMSAFPAGFPTYVYPADEVNGCPNLAENLQAWAQVAHAAGTKTLVTVTPVPALLNDGSGRPDVDYWALLPKQYCADGHIRPTEECVENTSIPTVLAEGNEIWSYNEQEQDYYSPKWLIDFAPINYRIFPGFMNQQFGFTGLMYSDVAHWSSDPWNNVQSWVSGGYTFPGDGVLVYPGQQVGLSSVVPSMRLKYVRDGVDDYDYMAMLRAQGQDVLVESILGSIAPDWINWTKSTSALESARIQMGQELDRLGGGSGGGGSMQPPANPWPASGSESAATSLTLQWSSVAGATEYQLYMSQSSATLPFVSAVPITVGPTVNRAVHNLKANATYYWRIVATNGTTSITGPVWSFTTP
jgi:Domain of unknown function (DUF4091)